MTGLPLLAGQPPGAQGGAAAGRRRDDAGRGERRRRARGQGVRPGGARDRALPRPVRAHLPPGASAPPGCRPRYVPAMSSLPSLAIAGVLLVGGYQVVDGEPDAGRLLRRQRLPAAAGRAAADDRHVGRPVPARDGVRRARSSRCSTRSATSSSGRTPGRCPTARGGPRSRASASATTPGRTGAVATSTSTIAAGRTVALIGPTGCGKTTLTALIPRFYDVDRGRVLLDGQDVRDATLDSLRGAIGIVGQDTFLFSTTVAENIAYGAPEATPEQIVRGRRARPGARVHQGPARRLRHARSASAA